MEPLHQEEPCDLASATDTTCFLGGLGGDAEYRDGMSKQWATDPRHPNISPKTVQIWQDEIQQRTMKIPELGPKFQLHE